MTASRQRMAMRWAHLSLSFLLGLFVYSPLVQDELFAGLVRGVVFPAMTLSGVLMWQQGRIARLTRGAAR